MSEKEELEIWSAKYRLWRVLGGELSYYSYHCDICYCSSEIENRCPDRRLILVCDGFLQEERLEYSNPDSSAYCMEWIKYV